MIFLHLLMLHGSLTANSNSVMHERKECVMKKIGLGIAIILFMLLIEVSVEGYFSYISWLVGAVGIGFAIAGFMEK